METLVKRFMTKLRVIEPGRYRVFRKRETVEDLYEDDGGGYAGSMSSPDGCKRL